MADPETTHPEATNPETTDQNPYTGAAENSARQAKQAPDARPMPKTPPATEQAPAGQPVPKAPPGVEQRPDARPVLNAPPAAGQKGEPGPAGATSNDLAATQQEPDVDATQASDAASMAHVLRPPSGKGETVVGAYDVTKQFADQAAVQNVSFEVPRGTIFGYIGPSGCGKTTTIRLLTGVEKPTSGRVSVLATDPSKFTDRTLRRIGYMPQHFVLYPDLSVAENLSFAASIYGMGLRRGKRINDMLDMVELRQHQDKLTRHLSGGMQRRLSLAATLIHDPDLIFLDEPTTGLDPVLRRKVWDHIKGLRSEGRTFFVTTQYVAETADCDVVGIMDQGHLLVVDTPDGLRRQAYGGDVVDLRLQQPPSYQQIDTLSKLPVVKGGGVSRPDQSSLRLVVDEAKTAIPAVLDYCKDAHMDVESIEQYYPPFDDVFIDIMRKAHTHE